MSNVIMYPLDYSGRHPDNKIVGEPIGPAAPGNRAFVLRHGAFYTSSLVLRRADTNEPLTPRVDYNAVQLNIEATSGSGLQACQIIIIEPSAFGLDILVDAQMVGGNHSVTTPAIRDLIDQLALDDRVVRWGQIIGKPDGYNPAPHLHDVGDVYGFEFVVAALEGIRNAILLGDQLRWDEAYEYIDQQDNALRDLINRVDANLQAHITDYNNPHRLRAHHVNLGNLPNIPLATLQIALEGVSNVHLMSPYLTKQLLDTHALATGNVHNMTKDDIGLGLVDNFATATLAIALAGESREHFLTPHGMAAYVAQEIEDWAGPPGTVFPPRSSFTIQGSLSSPANVPHNLGFTSTAVQGTNPIVSWRWDMGDGRPVSTERNLTGINYTFQGDTATFQVSLTVADADGFTHTYSRTITLVKTAALQPPTAQVVYEGDTLVREPGSTITARFKKAVAAGSAPLANVRLENITTGEFLEHGPDGGEYFPWVFNLTSNGTYNYQFRITATDTYGLSASSTLSVSLVRQPENVPPVMAINFTGAVSYTNEEVPTLSFTEAVQEGNWPITAYNWSFSNGATSNLRVPPPQSFNLAIPGGTVWAKLVVTANGINYEVTRNIVITVVQAPDRPPTAAFTTTGTGTVTSGLTVPVGFTYQGTPGTGTITSVVWDFGDGTTLSGNFNPPTKNYSVQPGKSRTVTITLTLTNSVGLTGQTTRRVTLTNNAPATQPTGNWTHSGNQSVTAPEYPTVNVEASYTAGVYPITSYEWDWGDGTTSVGATAQKTYQITEGSYDMVVKLKVTSAAGTVATSQRTITISRANPAPIVAGFTVAGATSVVEGNNHSMTVTDTTSSPDSTITNWVWNWGDGTSSTGRNPGAKTYSVAVGATRSFTITLNVTDSLGRTESFSRTISLTKTSAAGPTANFTTSVTNSREPNNPTVSVTDTSAAGGSAIVGWSWNWGDGTTSTGRTPGVKTYSIANGTRQFTITLTTTDALGKVSEKSSTVTVVRTALVGPTANFSYTGSLGVAWNQTHSLDFTSNSTNGDAAIASYSWNIGGTTSTAANPPAVTFAVNAGASRTITVSLTVVDNNGKSHTKSENYTLTKTAVPASPTAGITRSGSTSVAHNQTHTLTFTNNSSNGGGQINNWQWSFSDGQTRSGVGPHQVSFSVAAGASANFSATLVVTDTNGLQGQTTISFTLTKGATPPPGVINTPQSLTISDTRYAEENYAPFCAYWLVTDGAAKYGTSQIYQNASTQWLTGNNPGDFEVYATVTDGNWNMSSTSTMNQWINLGTTRSWTTMPLYSPRQIYMVLNFKIRRVGTSQILADWNITMNANVYGGQIE